MSLAIANDSSEHQERNLENIARHNNSLPTATAARTMEKSEADEARKKLNREASTKPQKREEVGGILEDTTKKVCLAILISG